MHQKHSLFTSVLMSPCMKTILSTRGLKLTASIDFYQRTDNIFSSSFSTEDNWPLSRIHPSLTHRYLHNPQHNPLLLPSSLSYLILLLTLLPFLHRLPFTPILLLLSLPFLNRLPQPLQQLFSLLNHHLLYAVYLPLLTSVQRHCSIFSLLIPSYDIT